MCFALVGACGGGSDGSRDDGTAGTSSTSAGTTGTAGSGTAQAGSTTSTAGSGTGGASGGAGACTPVPGSKKGDGTNTVIDEIDGANIMFMPGGVGSGSWDLSKDTSPMGMITPAGTAALAPTDGGHTGKALHVQGSKLTGWGAALAAILNGTTASFDASAYGGVAFWIKGTAITQDGTDKLMVLARMPDVLPGAGSCCDDKVVGSECYSAHRAVVGISAEWTEVKIAWADFKPATYGLGSTLPFNANRLRDITLSFNHDSAVTTGDGTSFDVWVDGMRFLTKDEMGNVSTGGGTAGSSSGGSATAGTGGGGGSTAAGTGGAAAGTGGTQ
ncbi:MAG TPA: hypothetical protein VHP33_14225 [Polyangiaceae bacterium]|nr:hypothetical protein [Polyangiaceae bacterium]